MEISTGLFSHMVLQRNADQVCDVPLTGHAASNGPVTASVKTAAGKALRGLQGMAVGTVRGGRLKARLTGIPVGGPYTITLRVGGARGAAAVTVEDVLVGDLWLMAGQSNMQGVGWLEYALPPDPAVRAFYMDDRWAVAQDPLHNMWDCVDPVHIALNGGNRPVRVPHWGICPGLACGQELWARTGVPQGLIACAHGGTSMQQWDPAAKDQGGHSLYGALVRRLHKNGGRVAGMIWYQGESDSLPGVAEHYTMRMVDLIKALRRDTGDRALPVAMVQLGRVVGLTVFEAKWNDIQEQQRRLPQVIKHLAVVPAVDLPLDDAIHISGDGQNVLGRRLAGALLALRGAAKAVPPIALDQVSTEKNAQSGLYDAVVTFRQVVGGLRATGEPRGFEVLDGANSNCCCRITLRGDQVVLRTGLGLADLEQRVITYGRGTDPMCNITDGAERGLPVFAPQGLPKRFAYTPYCRSPRCSGVVPLPRPLAKLEYAETLALATSVRQFPGNFCDLHAEIQATTPQERLVVYAATYRCRTAMKLAVLLGYDGPVRLWLDGKDSFTDPAGTNPARADAAVTPWTVTAGTHTIVVALTTNQGRAWGVFLRLQRLDVTPKMISRGAEHYAMPELEG